MMLVGRNPSMQAKGKIQSVGPILFGGQLQAFNRDFQSNWGDFRILG
jgi:hypothetical protein